MENFNFDEVKKQCLEIVNAKMKEMSDASNNRMREILLERKEELTNIVLDTINNFNIIYKEKVQKNSDNRIMIELIENDYKIAKESLIKTIKDLIQNFEKTFPTNS